MTGPVLLIIGYVIALAVFTVVASITDHYPNQHDNTAPTEKENQ